jgi:hypothetical protein
MQYFKSIKILLVITPAGKKFVGENTNKGGEKLR